MSLYSEDILYHYHHPSHFGTLSHPTCSSDVKNSICGDSITMEIRLDGGVVADIAFSGHGCAISIAAASLLSEFAMNKSKVELMKIDSDRIMSLLGIEISAARLKCALLPLEALHKALEKV